MGVVGTGDVAALHLRALTHSRAAELIGVCDLDERRARQTARTQPGECRWTTSLDEMLTWPEVKGVIVCTPNSTHAAIAEHAAGSGRHILVEKPLALDLESADRVIAAAEQHGVVLMPGHTHRFYDYGRAVMEAIGEGRIGRPTFAGLTALAGWIWGDWRAWVLDPSRSGGHLLHNGVHGLDLVTWWMGDEPVEVVARGSKVTAPGLQLWDYFHAVVRYRRGGCATVEFSRTNRPRAALDRDAVVAGTEGILTIPVDAWGGEIRTESATTPLWFDAQAGFDREVAAWVDAAANGTAPPVTAQDGRRAVEMALAAERSIESGEPVALDG